MKRKKKTENNIKHNAATSTNISFVEEGAAGVKKGAAESQPQNIYAQAVDAGHKVDPRAQKIFVLCVVLIALYAFALIFPKNIFNSLLVNPGYTENYSVSWFISSLQSNLNGLVSVFTGNENPVDPFHNTMIRYVVIAITGAGLALCGAVYQGSFKNALVSPSTLGVMSGATLGMMIWFICFVDDDCTTVPWLSGYVGDPNADPLGYLVATYSLAVISFAGCMVVVGIVLLVLAISNKKNKSSAASPIMMIICGQVIGGVVGAFSTEVRYFYVAQNPYSAKAQLLTDLMVSSFYRNFTWIDIVAIMVPLALTFFAVMRLRNRMSLLSLDVEEARTLGVDSRNMRYLLIALCTLLTAILISFCGTVGFVGFLVPHLARRLVGPNFNYLLPAATVLGAVFVLAAYTLVAITAGPELETSTGMFISIGGAAVFLVTALRGGGGARGEFR